jgi:hypothetical protein
LFRVGCTGKWGWNLNTWEFDQLFMNRPLSRLVRPSSYDKRWTIQGLRNTVARRPSLAVLGLVLVSNNIPMVRRDSWSEKMFLQFTSVFFKTDSLHREHMVHKCHKRMIDHKKSRGTGVILGRGSPLVPAILVNTWYTLLKIHQFVR